MISSLLLKIKLKKTFVRLKNQFNISMQASKIFYKCVIKLANVLKILIYFSDKENKNQYRLKVNYSDVITIIDAFKIQIEKSSNPMHHAYVVRI